jgi:hypothetical protein
VSPVRVKYYRLLSLTRRQYLVLQVILLTLFLILLTVALTLPIPPALREAARTDFKARLIQLLWENFLWIGLLVLLLEAVETFIMLQKFACKEAEQKTGSPPTETAAGPK